MIAAALKATVTELGLPVHGDDDVMHVLRRTGLAARRAAGIDDADPADGTGAAPGPSVAP